MKNFNRSTTILALASGAVLLALASSSCTTTGGAKPTKTQTPTTVPSGPTSTPTSAVTSTPTDSPTSACQTPVCTATTMVGKTLYGSSLLVPQLTPQLDGPVSLPADNYWRYDMCVTTGVTYSFSFCNNGGTFTNDSYLRIFDTTTCAELAFDDDTCGLGSELVWTATLTGPVFLQVHEFGSAWAAWTYTLAYWHN